MTTPTSTIPDILIQPYLYFQGNTEEALDFYKKALDAEIEMMMRFSDSPEPMPEGMIPPGYENKIMHASFKVAGSTVMCSDGCGDSKPFAGFALSYAHKSQKQCEKVFEALSESGKVTMPLQKTFWTPLFGMCTDKFGIDWMVSIIPEDHT